MSAPTPVAPPPLPQKIVKIGNNGDITTRSLKHSSLSSRSKFCAALKEAASDLEGIDTKSQTPVVLLDSLYSMGDDGDEDFASMKRDAKFTGAISVIFLKNEEILPTKELYAFFGNDIKESLKQGKPETVAMALESRLVARPPRVPTRE